MGRLDGKVCVVTGAGSGIGRASAHLCAGEGASVACADVAGDRAEAVAGEIAARGGSGSAHAVDVTDQVAVAGLYEDVERRFGAIHVLVNNAGVLLPGDRSVVDTELAAWSQVLAINLTGVFLCCKHGLPKLLAAGGGSIVNMASISGLIGSATSQIAYAASKGGVIALTRDIGIEFANRGVRANAVCPGPVETPLSRHLYPSEAEWRRRQVHIPGGRLGSADDVAEAVLYLASDASRWVNATAFVVDGGITAAFTTPE